MTFAQLVSKLGMQMVPAIVASVVSGAVLGALHWSPGPTAQAQRGASQSGEPTVYVDVMPRINRDPVPAAAVAPLPPVPTETPAAPVKTAPHPRATATPPAGERAARAAPAGERAARAAPAARPDTAAPAKVDPVAAVEPPPKVESIPKVAEAGASAPPMPIVDVPLRSASLSAEPTHILGMPVPQPVSDAGGAVVDVAKLPIQFADTIVARPVWRVGEKIVSGVAGWIIPGSGR